MTKSAIAALIIGFLGIATTWFMAWRQHREKQLNSERIEVTIMPYKRPYPIEWFVGNDYDKTQQLYLVKKWECLLINTGDKGVSITHFEIPSHVDVIAHNNRAYSITASKEEGDIIRLGNHSFQYLPDKEIPLPINIAPDSSERFIIKIALPIESQVQDILQEAINSKIVEDNILDALKFLKGKNLKLLLGNTLDQFAEIYFVTARKNKFLDIITLNETAKREGRVETHYPGVR